MSVTVYCGYIIRDSVPAHIQTDSQTDFSHPHMAIISLNLGIQKPPFIYVTAAVMRSFVYISKTSVDINVSQLLPV